MMAEVSTDLLEMILRECAATTPQPWYPSAYAEATGVPRDALDASLDQLRLGGLIRLTDWVQGRGQGYVLTPEGAGVVHNPRLLNRLRANGVPPGGAPAWVGAPRPDARPTTWDRGEAVRAALLAPMTPRVTLTLLFLNILVFGYGCALAGRQNVAHDFLAGGGNRSVMEILHETGAMQRADISVHGQWWRLLSCCFVHFGALHLLANMYSLYVVGPLLERMWGPWRFLLLYLIAGLVGSCTMFVFSENPHFTGAGASGALWGVMASMATWVFLNRRHLPRQLVAAWKRSLLIVFLLNVFITYSFPGISASAHFGGGVAGLVVGVPLEYVRYGHGWRRWLAAAGVAAVPLASLALVEHSLGADREAHQIRTSYRPKVLDAYVDEIKKFNESVKPLMLAPMPGRRQDPQAEKAAAAAAEVEGRMQDTAAVLAQAGDAFRDPAASEAMGAARAYVQAAGKFYHSFRRALDRQVTWTNEDEQVYGQQYRDLRVSRKEFADRWLSPPAR